MKADQIITRAKVNIILNQPFYASIMLGMEFKQSKLVPTAGTNGDEIILNPDFIETLSVNECVGLIIHEIMHVTNLHHLRQGGRDTTQWNIAADFAINPILQSCGIYLPEGGLIDRKYDNMSAEQIYRIRQQETQQKPEDKNSGGQGDKEDDQEGNQEGQGDGQSKGDGKGTGWGEVTNSTAKNSSELAEKEASLKQRIAQAAQVAKMQDKLPEYLEEQIKTLLEGEVNWKAVLIDFVKEKQRNDYNFSRPNSRYPEFMLPSLYSEELGEIVLAVDTSGSIDRELLQTFASEVFDISNTFHKGFTVVYCDTRIAGVQEIEPDSEMVLDPKGGGGTDFVPPFVWVEKEGIDPACFIYFTDGYCDTFPPEPDYPVMWVVYNNKNFTPPFGEVLHIN